jgi:LAS superfamily LD-carboxypeptidase LdcB
MQVRPLLVALLFSAINFPAQVRSQTTFDTSNTPDPSVSTDYLTDNFTFSLADMGAVQSGGSADYPGLGQVDWDPGTRPEDLFTVGMLSDYGFKNLSIDQIGATTGQPLSQAALSSFPLVQNLTVPQLVRAIPGLAQTPLNQAPPIEALARQQGVAGEGDGTVGGIASAVQGPIGQLGGQLVNYGISQIPGLSQVSLGQLPGISNAKISDIPGLTQFPLFNPLSIKDWFVPFDIGFGMSSCSMGGDCHERNIDNTASGNMQDMSIPCKGAQQSCAHIEVRRNGSNPADRSRWISKEQKVPGGSGLGSAICSEEPTGRFPLGPNPKVVLENINEKEGKIEFALYFSVHVDLDESDSAHCFGPLPMLFFGSAKEGGLILFGPDAVPKNSPFASMGRQSKSGSSPQCTQAPSAQGPPDTAYGHKTYAEAKQSDLVSVPTNASLNSTEVLQKDAASAFNKMQQAAAAQGIDLNVVSGFRSVATQKQLWDAQVAKQGSPEAAAKISAPPGYSEHATGYAFDIGVGNDANLTAGFENTPAYQWLSQNAAKYGFDQSFTKTSTIGADNEPWHWRYEGTPQAKQTFSTANSNSTAPSTVVRQSGGCETGGYGGSGSCVVSDGKTAAAYKGVDIAAFKNAITNVESRTTGLYKAVGVYVNDGQGNIGRALGKYQFMSYGPAKDIIGAKSGGAQFLAAMSNPNIDGSSYSAQVDQLFTSAEQEALMDAQVKHLADLVASQGLTGDRLIKRMAEMHTGGDGAPSGVDNKYSDSVVADYKKGGCVAGSGTSTGNLQYPVSAPISEGYLTDSNNWRGRPHLAIDFRSPMGTPIHAADGGVVTFAGWDGDCGNRVTIDHKNGFTTTYCHMSQLNTAKGTPVSVDQVIGLVGSTGHSTGPHLHFAVRKNGEPVNPLLYLKGQ